VTAHGFFDSTGNLFSRPFSGIRTARFKSFGLLFPEAAQQIRNVIEFIAMLSG
jgi:hypothetical protein